MILCQTVPELETFLLYSQDASRSALVKDPDPPSVPTYKESGRRFVSNGLMMMRLNKDLQDDLGTRADRGYAGRNHEFETSRCLDTSSMYMVIFSIWTVGKKRIPTRRKLNEVDVYVSQPEGFVDPEPSTSHVYRLMKALYGLNKLHVHAGRFQKAEKLLPSHRKLNTSPIFRMLRFFLCSNPLDAFSTRDKYQLAAHVYEMALRERRALCYNTPTAWS
ncbi:hypothetical protein Tco_1069054 [Tanacetum coccineum]|uniref:Uncharacterized protein n=1 Tax=Tanacetum coccineum TaxID=301880 RepID=A0ABQ5HJD1_9ASTR